MASWMASAGISNVRSTASASSMAAAAAITVEGRTATSSSICQTIEFSPSSPTKTTQTALATSTRDSTAATSILSLAKIPSRAVVPHPGGVPSQAG
jgi:hypothetical protein